VHHRIFDFRGVFDIDPVFASSDEWYESFPKVYGLPGPAFLPSVFAECGK
jgi:hypothetical protein